MKNINRLEYLKKYNIIIAIIILLFVASVFITLGNGKERNNIDNNTVYEINNTIWSGEYTSNGDLIKGTLEFKSKGTALFTFECTNKDNTKVMGSYTMNIEEFHEESGYIYLTGLKWENQPYDLDWKFNKLHGGVSENYIVGTVISNNDNQFVGGFEFKKVK